jgi:hypothetical protein
LGSETATVPSGQVSVIEDEHAATSKPSASPSLTTRSWGNRETL